MNSPANIWHIIKIFGSGESSYRKQHIAILLMGHVINCCFCLLFKQSFPKYVFDDLRPVFQLGIVAQDLLTAGIRYKNDTIQSRIGAAIHFPVRIERVIIRMTPSYLFLSRYPMDQCIGDPKEHDAQIVFAGDLGQERKQIS